MHISFFALSKFCIFYSSARSKFSKVDVNSISNRSDIRFLYSPSTLSYYDNG